MKEESPMSDHTIRLATPDDLDEMMQIFEYAREQMRLSGNPNQWGNSTPAREVMAEYIEKNVTYVITSCTEKNREQILGTFVFFVGEDPTYNIIYDGQWINDEPYGVIHKIARGPLCSGMLGEVIKFCEKNTDNIRIDTHEDNKIMQHLLEKYGFVRCGVILLENGEPRLAFQKVVDNS